VWRGERLDYEHRGKRIFAVRPQSAGAEEKLPPKSCDSQFHVSGEGYKTREGATYHSVGATDQAALHMHRTLGFERGVVVQSTVYATDHSLLVDTLEALGPNYRGIGVIDDTLSDADLASLKEAGVCGVRFSFLKLLNLVPSDDLFLRSAARCRELGWILKVNLASEGLTPSIVSMIRGLKDQPVVIDHMARIRGTDDPKHAVALDLLKQGNIWIMMSNGHRLSTPPHHDEAVRVAGSYIETAPGREACESATHAWILQDHLRHPPYAASQPDALEPAATEKTSPSQGKVNIGVERGA
jgi:predicted TIM-barrel fold metal-dependent hydrolase